MRSVVAVCGDPGGANAVAPVLKLLAKEARVSVRPLAYNEAISLWANQGIEVESLLPDLDREGIDELLRAGTEGLVLTGTSMNSLEFEKQFIAAAREAGLPSVAVLDFWSNYRRRFSDQDDGLVYLPDRIAVMDEQASREMTAAGIDPALLTVTGQPAFDALARQRESFTAAQLAQARQRLQLGTDDLLVVFASQPLARMYGDAASPTYLGYDERKVLRDLIAALASIAARTERPITLAIRPHPKEQDEDFSDYQSPAIKIVVSTDLSARDILMSADLVTGMSSNLLVEACYLGCIVVSLQPGLRAPDALPTNGAGLSRAVYRAEDFEAEIERMLTNEEARRAVKGRLSGFQPSGDATRRVVDLIYQMMGVEK